MTKKWLTTIPGKPSQQQQQQQLWRLRKQHRRRHTDARCWWQDDWRHTAHFSTGRCLVWRQSGRRAGGRRGGPARRRASPRRCAWRRSLSAVPPRRSRCPRAGRQPRMAERRRRDVMHHMAAATILKIFCRATQSYLMIILLINCLNRPILP